MAFTVVDFQDLVKLLGEHPEWQAELRRLLVGDQLAAIDARLEALVEAQQRTEQSLDALARRTDELAARTDELAARMDALVARMDAFIERMDAFSAEQRRMGIDIAGMKGDAVESRYRTNLPSYLGRQMKQMRLVIPTDLDLVSAAGDAGTLTDREWDALTHIDVLFSGALRSSSTPVLVAVEASAVIDAYDVERAIERAAILARLGYKTIPAVGGDQIISNARRTTKEQGVAVLLGGKVEYWPESAA